MPRGGKSSKEGLGFSRRSNLQNSMAAISTGISKLISVQGSLVQPLSCFHASDSTPLAPACKGETTHHGTSSCTPSARSIAPSRHRCHQLAWLGLQPGRTERPEAAQNQRRKAQHPPALALRPATVPARWDFLLPSRQGKKTRVNQLYPGTPHVPSSLSVRHEGFAASAFCKNTRRQQKAEDSPQDPQFAVGRDGGDATSLLALHYFLL